MFFRGVGQPPVVKVVSGLVLQGNLQKPHAEIHGFRLRFSRKEIH